MSSKFGNFHTHLDDCFPVSGNFDQHVASDYPTPRQHSKMPALLRLDSVGEVSSARLPSDRQMYNSRANTKPILRNSKSVDSPFTNRFLSNSSMASAKSLTRSPSKFHGDGQQMSAPSFTKAHSFAQEFQPQLADTSFCGVKSLSSSFMFGHQSSDPNVFSMFAPAQNYSKLFSSSPSNQISPSVDTTFLTGMDNYIARGQDGRAASILSTVAAAYVASIQPTCNWNAPSGAQPFLGSNRKDGVLNITKSSELPDKEVNNKKVDVSSKAKSCDLPGKDFNNQNDDISNITKLSELSGKEVNKQNDEISNTTSSELPVTEVQKSNDISIVKKSYQLQSTQVKHRGSMKNVETQEAVAPSPDANKATDLSVIFDGNLTDEVCFSIVDSSLNSDLMQWSLDDRKPSGKRTRNSASKSSNDGNSCLVDSLHNSLKSMVSSALSAPRKAAKKGRPSSKKKRKRQREKRKQESSPCVFTGFSCSSNNTSTAKEEEQALGSPSVSVCQLVGSNNSVSSSETSNSVLSSSIPSESSPVKPQSKCSISSLFFMSDLDETDDDDDDNSDESFEWSDNEDVCRYISPIKCSTFNVALNLDVIFKRKSIPSLKSVLGGDESESDSETSSTQSAQDKRSPHVSSSTSNDDSFEDKSVGVCVPLVAAAAALAPFNFTMGLSLDSLFTKKPSLCSSADAKVIDSTFDVVDGPSTSADHPHLSSSIDSDPQVMKAINAKWNEVYPTAGFRSCQDASANEITDSNIKVHFATEANLKTVHIVEAEDRAGKWHLCSLDQERFQRKILDLEKVVSPVLEASHRAKVLKQNQTWERGIVPNDM